MSEWLFEYHVFEPKNQMLREALCTLGNGYFATRGAFEESDADDIHYPGTYLACGYNRLKTQIGENVIENEDLVNFPNWLSLKFSIQDGPWFSLEHVKVLSFKQMLHLKEGLLTREITFEEQGRTSKLTSKRFVSMANPHLAAIHWTIEAMDWEGEITIHSALDGQITNGGVKRYHQLNNTHLEPLEAKQLDDHTLFLQVRTNQSHLEMAICARTCVAGYYIKHIEEEGFIAQEFRTTVKKKQKVEVEKVIALYTSRDPAISECGLAARQAIAQKLSFAGLFKQHKLAWKHLWKRFDIQIVCEDPHHEVSKLLRLHLFHILQTASPHSRDLDVGIPPRGWHGEAYRGHILWDELFVFPTLNLQLPELTRALLLYRYRRLPKAKLAAQKAHLAGALFPWQSGSDGREESQEIHLNPLSKRWIPDNSALQRHINGAVVYNVWQHFEATGDIEFLSFYGAEMIFEIAELFSSLASFDHKDHRYHIVGVMGPDEYHDAYPDAKTPGIDDNAYTNVLVSWVMTRALQAFELLPEDRKEELAQKLHLTEKDLDGWMKISENLYIPFHEDGVISQFEGYEKLKELDWETYEKRYENIKRLDRILEAEGDNSNNYKASKQADVLMLFFLFSAEELRLLFEKMGYELSGETIEKTVDYYLSRTSHGSSLSRLVHSWVLSRSDRKRSWDFFHDLLLCDVEDVQGGTTKEGIHLGAMAGTIDLLQRCYTGIEYRQETLRFNPSLPQEIRELKTIIRYRGHTLSIFLDRKKLAIESKRASVHPIQIACVDAVYPLAEGEKIEFLI